MGRNTDKICWVQIRKCLKDHSKELVVVKGQKKEKGRTMRCRGERGDFEAMERRRK